MKCHYHPEYDAVSTCSKCGQPICKACESFDKPVPVCLNCYEQHILNLPKIEYKKSSVEIDIKAIVIPVIVVVGTGLFTGGTIVNYAGLMIVGVILLAVSILGLRWGK